MALGVIVGAWASAPPGGGELPAQGSPSYRKSVGTGTTYDVTRLTRKILDRHAYEIEREDTSSFQVTIESRWTGRAPLKDEADSGVVEVKTRLTITARARGRQTVGLADVRVVQLRAENMVLAGDSAEWRTGFMTPMFKKYIDRIVDELKTELQTGVRIF